MANKKTVDVSGKNNKVDAAVKNYITKVEKRIARNMSDFNVPILEVLKPTFTLELYFLNYEALRRLMGDFMSQVDRMVVGAIVDTMAEDLAETMTTNKGYIGLWDSYIIRDMFITSLMIAHDTEGYYMTTCQIARLVESSSELEYPEEARMDYKNYNPNKFFVFVNYLHTEVTKTISNYMSERIPKVFAYDGKPNLNIALYDLFIELMVNRHQVNTALQDVTGVLGTDEYINAFTAAFDRPFLLSIGVILLNCGIAEDVVNDTLANSEFNAVYDDPAKVALNDMTIVYTIRSTIDAKNAASISFRISDMITMLTTEADKYPKTRKTSFGKLFKKFILDCCTVAANTNIDLIRQEKTALAQRQKKNEGASEAT